MCTPLRRSLFTMGWNLPGFCLGHYRPFWLGARGSWGQGWARVGWESAGWGEEAHKGTQSCAPPEWAMGAPRSLGTECVPHQGGYLLLGSGACPAFFWGATGLFDSGAPGVDMRPTPAQQGIKSSLPPEWAMGAAQSLNTEYIPHQDGYLLLRGQVLP
jgi:hypothetical protein